MRAKNGLKTLLFGILTFLVLGAHPGETAGKKLDATIDQLLGFDVRPFAIGHRGFGENLGEDSSRPIEDTVRAVRAGFRAGVSVVEVDVQLTRDGKVAVFHDDFLSDFTCINSLTLAELQARLPHVPSLRAVLNQARKFNRSEHRGSVRRSRDDHDDDGDDDGDDDRGSERRGSGRDGDDRSGPLRGLVIVEMKALSPHCDPGDLQEQAIVSAVARVIRRKGMTHQVLLTSFSPALLFVAAAEAPEITRGLTISGLQFLRAEQVEALLGLPVTPIDKGLDLGLQWAEIGPIFRLPGYRSVDEVLSTVAVTGAQVVEADLFFLRSVRAAFVDALHGFGLKVFGFTANNASEWFFLESVGVDGIYTNDIPLGVQLQCADSAKVECVAIDEE